MSKDVSRGVRDGAELVLRSEITLSDLSDVTDEFVARIGFGDSLSADFTDGIYFEYDRLANVNWLMCCASGGVRTKTSSGVVVAATKTELEIAVSSARDLAEFFVNGALVGSVNTNIPSGILAVSNCIANLVRSAGTNARTAKIGYFGVDWVVS